jgi:hypothetical protein
LDKASAALTAQITTATKDSAKKISEIRELEKQTTSIQPTIDGINSLLSSFGFQGFKLAKAASGTSYKLVRSDGSDAKATLSEGEKTFVTFLYFYHLLKGSDSDSSMTTDRIVVFDDPVSSLDSDILFIVGSLIDRARRIEYRGRHQRPVFGEGEWRRRGEFKPGEVVTICDHLQFLLRRKLKHEILGETIPIALYCLIQYLGRHAIELRQVRIDHHLMAANGEDASIDTFDGDGFYGGH